MTTPTKQQMLEHGTEGSDCWTDTEQSVCEWIKTSVDSHFLVREFKPIRTNQDE